MHFDKEGGGGNIIRKKLTRHLFRELFQKVIALEQNQCQSDIKISQLLSQVEALKIEKEEILSRSLNGEYVWRIKDFSGYHEKMRKSHNFVIYSKGFYTSYYGYKVCLRSNIYFSEGTYTTLLLNALFVELMLCYIRRGISGNICTFYER